MSLSEESREGTEAGPFDLSEGSGEWLLFLLRLGCGSGVKVPTARPGFTDK